MSEPFLAEIRIVGFNFAPRGWAFCDGQILPINQNQSLYSLLGTTYGGDGRTSFALPDLRGRTPIHVSDGHQLAQKSGAETVTLTAAEIAAHTHVAKASSDSADNGNPTGRSLAAARPGATLFRNPGSSKHDDLEVRHSNQRRRRAGSQQHSALPDTQLLHRAPGALPLPQLTIADHEDTDMSEPFVGEIRMFAGNFAPRGWAFCDGQLLAVSQNDALFSLLGTIYGGDGRTTYGLPDMRGRIPLHQGTGPGLSPRRLGAKSGAEQETLTSNQLASHSHDWNANTATSDLAAPAGKVLAGGTPRMFNAVDQTASLAPTTIASTGGSGHHTNLMPTLCVHFIIALVGIYPSRQ